MTSPNIRVLAEARESQGLPPSSWMLFKLGNLAMRSARVERLPEYPDGRRENDAEHAFMLALLAPQLAVQLYPDLDTGIVSQYAVIHDLVEVYTGDVITLGITDEELQEKADAEDAAVDLLCRRFQDCPSLVKLIEDYHLLIGKEARFVKAVDKLMPTIVHLANNGVMLRQIYGEDLERYRQDFDQNTARMAKYCYDMPELLRIRADMHRELDGILLGTAA